MSHHVVLIIIMSAMGIMGGVINFFILALDEPSRTYFLFKNIFAGLGATALVPVFLQAVSSELLWNGRTTVYQYFLFAGICLGAALISRVFINTFPKAVIQKIGTLEDVGDPPDSINKTQSRRITPENKNSNEMSERTEFREERGVDESEELSSEAMLVMSTLKRPNYIFMTLEELAAEINLGSNYIAIILEQLQEMGLVTSIQKDQQTLWGLTYKGYNSSV